MPKHAAVRAPKPLHTPHDKHAIINRAPSPRWIENFREQIKVKELIARLQNFGLDDPDNPQSKRLTRTQAMVDLALLKKVLPDMQSLEISGNQDQPITVHVLRFSDLEQPTVSLQNDGAGSAHGPQQAQPAEPLVIDVLPDRIEHSPGLIEDEPEPSPKRGTRSR